MERRSPDLLIETFYSRPGFDAGGNVQEQVHVTVAELETDTLDVHLHVNVPLPELGEGGRTDQVIAIAEGLVRERRDPANETSSINLFLAHSAGSRAGRAGQTRRLSR